MRTITVFIAMALAASASLRANSIAEDTPRHDYGTGGEENSFGTAAHAIPEPGTFVLLGLGLVGISLLRRKRAPRAPK